MLPIVTMLCLLLMLSLAGNIILCFATVSLREEYEGMRNENLDLTLEKVRLQNIIGDNAEKIAFIDDYVVVVEDDGTNLYHKYGCPKFLGKSFWAFNTEAAESEGYKPCSFCCE